MERAPRVRRPDEEVARDLILKNRDALADQGRIRAKRDFPELAFDLESSARPALKC
jgi:hypothetical protein